MPALPPELLDTVVYLYPDTDAAIKGERMGGCGCLVVLPTQTEPYVTGFMYIVTASHNVKEGQTFVVRVNTRDGGMGIIENTQPGWTHHKYGDDLSVLSINLEYATVKSRGLTPDWFISKERMEQYKIGPGDETFMVGRFVSHEGKQKNTPAVRFGNIAMMPHEPVRTRRGLLQECFLVETRSLPGYSGSPVFVHPYPFNYFKREIVPPMFLGIDMGHLTDSRPVIKKDVWRQGRREKVDENWIVETNTGMSCVIPAWKVWELLHSEELMEQRRQVLEEFEKEKAASSVAFDSADDSESPSPLTQLGFEDFLKRVSRKKSSKT